MRAWRSHGVTKGPTAPTPGEFCIPTDRQAQIYARQGIDLDRSTLADWVGDCSRLLSPLVDALGRYVIAAEKLHADDTPVPVLDPRRGKTRTGRLWTYVRDDRPSGSTDPPAVLFRYSPDRKGANATRGFLVGVWVGVAA